MEIYLSKGSLASCLLARPQQINRTKCRQCRPHGQRRLVPRRAENSTDSQETRSSAPADETSTSGRQDLEAAPARGPLIAVGAIALGVAFFAATRLGGSTSTLATLERSSMELDAALQNGRPTLLEFYANWCEVCNNMAPDVKAVEDRYKGSLNFVMLNIENSKWLPEMAEYRVSGVPHFVFLNANGRPEAATVGRLPKQVLDVNTQALVEGKRLPFKKPVGETSSISGSKPSSTSLPSPRAHA